MILHTCIRCKIEFNKKSIFQNHLNSKKQCSEIILTTTLNPLENIQIPIIVDKTPHNYHNLKIIKDVNILETNLKKDSNSCGIL